MELMVEAKRTSTPGDTCAPPLCAVHASIEPIVFYKRTHTTTVCLPHAPRWEKLENLCVDMI